MKLQIATILCLIIFCTSCKKENTIGVTNNINPKLNELFEKYYLEKLQLFPLVATQAGINDYNHLFENPLNDHFIKRQKDFYKQYLLLLSKFDQITLSESDQLSKDILTWECTIALEQLTFKEDLLPINHFSSLHLTFAQLGSTKSDQPFLTLKDYSNWLDRLMVFDQWVNLVEKKLEAGAKNKYTLPQILADNTISQLQNLADTNIETNLFYAPLRNFPKTFSNEEKARITEEYSNFIGRNLIPSIQKVHDYMKNEYRQKCRTTYGLWDLPNGKNYYSFLIKKYTTTNLTADEIHDIGLKEVARISKEMEKVKNQVKFKGELKDFFDYVRNKKELMPFTEANQVIENFEKIHEKIKPNLALLFDLKPKTAFEIKRTDRFKEATASAEYSPGSLDGKRPGIFYVPIPDVTKYNYYADEDLFLHEAIPGHHYQISLQQEDTNLPNFRKAIWFNAYGEGWALYTESLGKELGLYTDPYQYFGMLSAEMHRAIRLVVDTGIHSKGWTKQEAIEYSIANEAEPIASITNEIERYIAIPGQALSYKIGELKIQELKQQAKKQLGKKFDIKAFHNEILEEGCLPLEILENKINRWIKIYK